MSRPTRNFLVVFTLFGVLPALLMVFIGFALIRLDFTGIDPNFTARTFAPACLALLIGSVLGINAGNRNNC